MLNFVTFSKPGKICKINNFSLLIILFLVVVKPEEAFSAGSKYSIFPVYNTELNYKAPSIYEMKSPAFRDSSDCNYTKRRFWRSTSEWSLAQILPWAYNRYVRDAEFAKVSWESIKYNLDFDHWEWDDNNFMTNQFAHPYQGSMYFSAFRSNGYNFWQSAPAALLGSYVWEVAGETHPASPNDWINTTLGGISLGEMTYRVSNLIIDNTQHGFKRQVNEVLAFLVNPMNGLNRIIDGKWGRVCTNSPELKPSFLNGNFDIGYRRFAKNINDVIDKGDREFYLRASFIYGKPFEDYNKPFGAFAFIIEAGASDSAFVNRVYVNGILQGWHLKESENTEHVFMTTMNYDYIRNTVFQYGAQSFRGTVLSKFTLSEKTKLYTEAGVVGIAIAAVPDDYLLYGEGRNYDFGPGAGIVINPKLNVNEKFILDMSYVASWFFTVNGNESNHTLHNLSFEPRYFVSHNFSLGCSLGYLSLVSDYEDFEDVDHNYPYVKAFVGFRIGE